MLAIFDFSSHVLQNIPMIFHSFEEEKTYLSSYFLQKRFLRGHLEDKQQIQNYYWYAKFSRGFQDEFYTLFNRLRGVQDGNCLKVMFELGIESLFMCDFISSSLTSANYGGYNSHSIQLITSEYSSALKLIFGGVNDLSVFLLASIYLVFRILRSPSRLMFFLSFWVIAVWYVFWLGKEKTPFNSIRGSTIWGKGYEKCLVECVIW